MLTPYQLGIVMVEACYRRSQLRLTEKKTVCKFLIVRTQWLIHDEQAQSIRTLAKQSMSLKSFTADKVVP